jgi:multicomponent Na+:H+ antiporter subunit D
MSNLAAFPLILPLFSAALGFALWRSARLQAVVGVVGSLAHVAAATVLFLEVLKRGVVVTQPGSWPAPFGITLAADMFGAVMVLVASVVGLAVCVYAVADVDDRTRVLGFYPLVHVLLAGVSGSFLTGDLFNLYVCFEIMLIASFVLLAIGGRREQIEGAFKYVTLNLVGSLLFLIGAGLTYAIAGTLNFADLSRRLPVVAEHDPFAVLVIGAMLLVSFGIKAGVFPLHFWLPAAYHTPQPAISALFAGLLTKVGVYALVRAAVVILPLPDNVFATILVVAGFTMVFGVMGAVSQFEIFRILGFHIVSQIGYMVLGLGLLLSDDPDVRRLALAATIFYIVHHILVKTNLYLIGGIVRQMRGTADLARIGGLAVAAPWLAILFLVPALSLAGIPPLSGFWAKLAMVQAGLAAGQWLAVAAAIGAGVLTLMSMVKIWNEAFWKPSPAESEVRVLPRWRMALLTLPVVLLALGTVTIGLAPEPFFAYADRAATQLLEPGDYIDAVLGTSTEVRK